MIHAPQRYRFARKGHSPLSPEWPDWAMLGDFSIARALGDALVAPVIAYVPEGAIAPPTGHMRFPGTITTPEDAFEKVLESAARSFKAHGFRAIVLLGDHGVLAGCRPGTVIAIHATIQPATCRELSAAAAERGAVLLDAPVSGGRGAALAGSLVVAVGWVLA